MLAQIGPRLKWENVLPIEERRSPSPSPDRRPAFPDPDEAFERDPIEQRDQVGGGDMNAADGCRTSQTGFIADPVDVNVSIERVHVVAQIPAGFHARQPENTMGDGCGRIVFPGKPDGSTPAEDRADRESGSDLSGNPVQAPRCPVAVAPFAGAVSGGGYSVSPDVMAGPVGSGEGSGCESKFIHRLRCDIDEQDRQDRAKRPRWNGRSAARHDEIDRHWDTIREGHRVFASVRRASPSPFRWIPHPRRFRRIRDFLPLASYCRLRAAGRSSGPPSEKPALDWKKLKA